MRLLEQILVLQLGVEPSSSISTDPSGVMFRLIASFRIHVLTHAAGELIGRRRRGPTRHADTGSASTEAVTEPSHGVASQAWHSLRESTRPPSPARWSFATRRPVRSCGPRRRRIPTAPRSIRDCGGRHCRTALLPRGVSTMWPRCRSAPSSTAWCAWTAPARSFEMRCCGTTLDQAPRPPNS